VVSGAREETGSFLLVGGKDKAAGTSGLHVGSYDQRPNERSIKVEVAGEGGGGGFDGCRRRIESKNEVGGGSGCIVRYGTIRRAEPTKVSERDEFGGSLHETESINQSIPPTDSAIFVDFGLVRERWRR